MNFTFFLTLLTVALIGAWEVDGSGNCGRVFEDVPGLATFGDLYIDAFGREWGAGGGGTISIKSRNGEIQLTKLETDADFNAIFITDDRFGYVVGSTGSFPDTRATVYATRNDGETWVKQKASVKAGLEAIKCVDHLTCWAVGQKGALVRTTNGGDDWIVGSIGSDETFVAVDFVDRMTGWIVGERGLVMKTTDGGTTWKKEKAAIFSTDNYSERHSIVWKGIGFRDKSQGCIAGHNKIVCTSDSGRSWNRTVFDDREGILDFVGFAFYDDKIRVLEECAKDLESFDRGKTWRAVEGKELSRAEALEASNILRARARP
jgi:photosystem II stability/assembly factor-like uncharacterized protein